MKAVPSEYIVPIEAAQRISPSEDLTNQDIFDFLIDNDYGYDAGEDGITVMFEEETDDTVYEYEVVFVPEENSITVSSPDRLEISYLSNVIVKFSPELFDYDEAEVIHMYGLDFIHPAVNFDTLAHTLDGAEVKRRNLNEQAPRALTYTFDGTDVVFFEEGGLMTADLSGEFLNEFVSHCNHSVQQQAPDTPDAFDFEALPNGWAAPVLLRHPALADIVEKQGLDHVDALEYTSAISDHDLTPNEFTVMGLDLIGAVFHAVDQIGLENRSAFYREIKGQNNLFYNLFLDDSTGELIDKEEFLETSFWNGEAARQVITDHKIEYSKLDRTASSYEGHDLNAGDNWTLDIPGVNATLHVRLEERTQMEDKRFPHRPVWTGEITGISDGETEVFDIGDPIIVSGEHLVARDE